MAADIVRVVKDKDRTLLRGEDEIRDRRLGHFDDLPNVENERENLEGTLGLPVGLHCPTGTNRSNRS